VQLRVCGLKLSKRFFFLKKEAKKLLLTTGRGRAGATARRIGSFLFLFFKIGALS
jgi:hypothetical protein